MEAVRDWLSRASEKIKTFWSEASRKLKILLIAAAAGVLVLLIALIVWVTHTNYVLLASGLSTQEYANVMSLLGEIGVEPQITSTGAILVPEDDVNRARMQLVQRMSGNAGYDLYQNLGITATQADKNQVSIYQNQERLRLMIETYEAVDRAEVQISIPQPSIYRLQDDNLPKTAAVQITKRPNAQLTAEQIQGILNLVRFSETGLTEENIAISDETGDLKLQLKNGTSPSKLLLTEQVNASIKNRVLQGLQPVYGPDNVQVAVNSVLDTDQKTIRETTYFPFDETNPQNNPLDLRERDYDKIGSAAEAAQGVPGVNDNADIPQYSAEDIDVSGGDSWRMHDIYDYLVSSVVSDITKEGLEITDVTVAVLVNKGDMSSTERDQVTDWVAGATGIRDNTKIKVQGMRFFDTSIQPAVPGADLQRVLLFTGIGLLALCVIFVILFLNIQKRNRERLAAAAEAAAEIENELSLAELLAGETEYEPIQLVETQEQKLRAQIRDLAESDPEIVAQLIKTWLVNA